MAWIKNPNCAQCRRPLSARDKARGTVCTPCVTGNRKSDALYDNQPDPGYTDEE